MKSSTFQLVFSSDGKTRDAILDQLREDSIAIFSAKAVSASEENYSTGSTFLIKASDKPRNGLESLALSIFQQHTKGKKFDPSKSCAEYWTQVIDPGDDIGLHWDRDYDMEEEQGIHKHPDVGTVTYLSDVGAPTVVFPVVGTNSADEPLAGEFSRFDLCFPASFRHLRFDGKLLHAAPTAIMEECTGDNDEDEASVPAESDGEGDESDDDAADAVDEEGGDDDDCADAEGEQGDADDADDAESDDSEDDEDELVGERLKASLRENKNGLRITFLVNIWLDHLPSQGVAPPKELRSSLQTPVDTVSGVNWTATAAVTHTVSELPREKYLRFVHGEQPCTVELPLPAVSDLERWRTESSGIVQIAWSPPNEVAVLRPSRMLPMMAFGDSDDDNDDGEDEDEDGEEEEVEEEEEEEVQPKKKQRR